MKGRLPALRQKTVYPLGRAADFKGDGKHGHAIFAELAATLAVLVGKFAVGDGGGGNLHDGSPCFGLDSKEILAEKGRLKTGFWVFRRPYKDLKLTISWKTWICRSGIHARQIVFAKSRA